MEGTECANCDAVPIAHLKRNSAAQSQRSHRKRETHLEKTEMCREPFRIDRQRRLHRRCPCLCQCAVGRDAGAGQGAPGARFAREGIRHSRERTRHGGRGGAGPRHVAVPRLRHGESGAQHTRDCQFGVPDRLSHETVHRIGGASAGGAGQARADRHHRPMDTRSSVGVARRDRHAAPQPYLRYSELHRCR